MLRSKLCHIYCFTYARNLVTYSFGNNHMIYTMYSLYVHKIKHVRFILSGILGVNISAQPDKMGGKLH
jgi:hypothetical protein